MSNYHLNDKQISLKAKGLLSQMLSLPESWDYTLRGLAYINKESLEAVRTAVLELEKHGYINRAQTRKEHGKLGNIEYTIYEQPPCLENPNTAETPCFDLPCSEKPYTVNPISENQMQVNTNIVNNQEEITDLINLSERTDGDMDAYREIILANIGYSELVQEYDRERVDEVVELILDTLLSTRATIRVYGEDRPAEVVKNRLLQLRKDHIIYVFVNLDKTLKNIKNMRRYLLTALFCAPTSTYNHRQQASNADGKEQDNEHNTRNAAQILREYNARRKSASESDS